MPDFSAQIEIPNRALFKAAEVCDLVKVQPYVLRSWESEFPDLGVAKSAGSPRVYRRADVEQVVRIRHLLLVEGLTLAGARRKLQEEGAPAVADAPEVEEFVGRNARERLTTVKRGLRSILDLLSLPRTGSAVSGEAADVVASGLQEFRLAPESSSGNDAPSRTAAMRTAPRTGVSRGKRSA